MGIFDRLTGSDRDRFAAEVVRVARRTPGVTEPRYDRARFAVVVRRADTGGPVWIYLSNAFRECAGASRAERRERIERLIRIMVTTPSEDTWDTVCPMLRPVVRPTTFAQGMPGMEPPMSRPAMPFLRELVVVDRPESMMYVTPALVQRWSVTVDEVFDMARANLDRLADRSLEGRWAGQAITRMVDTGDGYFTSLLLAPGWLARVSERLGASAVAFVPDTNTVVVCPIPAGGGLGPMYELVEQEYREAVRALSPVGYVVDDRGRVVPFGPPAGHPDHLVARRAEVVLAVNEYGAQTQWLTEQYAEAGVDIFVAQLLAAERPDEPAITVATWTDGITSLLPEAQFVTFARDGVAGPRVPWRAVAELVDLEPEPLLSPTRYRVGGWPAPEVMAALAARAVE